ncbi:MAG: hypothetical protein KGO82_16850 [Bacteroidota bacterium]|nr:hypothetical protein [Bacteroidota bacterium]
MKRILIAIVALGLSFGASAQRFGHGFGGRVYVAPPRVSVGIGYSPFFYSPFGFYPYGYNSLYYNRAYRPTKLDLTIEDIKNDYSQKIWAAKHDDTVPRKERRKIVHQLRAERDQAIIDAKRNYYKQ